MKKHKHRSQRAQVPLFLSKERRQHDTFVLSPRAITDALGAIAQPWRAMTMLERLELKGDITPAMHDAGKEFARLYRLAASSPMQTSDLQREVRVQSELSVHLHERAVHQRDEALNYIGGPGKPAYSCAWNVLGDEQTLREWALQQGWNGHPIREEVAKGILIATLGALAKFFRL